MSSLILIYCARNRGADLWLRSEATSAIRRTREASRRKLVYHRGSFEGRRRPDSEKVDESHSCEARAVKQHQEQQRTCRTSATNSDARTHFSLDNVRAPLAAHPRREARWTRLRLQAVDRPAKLPPQRLWPIIWDRSDPTTREPSARNTPNPTTNGLAPQSGNLPPRRSLPRMQSIRADDTTPSILRSFGIPYRPPAVPGESRNQPPTLPRQPPSTAGELLRDARLPQSARSDHPGRKGPQHSGARGSPQRPVRAVPVPPTRTVDRPGAR
jgi:hypothetical protein